MHTSACAESHRKWNPGWGVVALLFLGSVINYVDRSVLGVVKPQIQRDLGLSNVQYGWVVNGFLATYTIFPFGKKLSRPANIFDSVSGSGRRHRSV